MAYFSQQCLERIRQQVSIVDVVSPYVQLKPTGRYLKGLSPFSHEKTPSFFVDPQKNIFKCFSSGYAGDIFRFLELKEQLTFTETVEWLCDRFNIPAEYIRTNKSQVQTTYTSKKILFDIYTQTALFFEQNFWEKSDTGLKTQHYWENERKFKLETAKIFNVGLAPIDPTLLYKQLQKQGFTREALEQSGIFYKAKSIAYPLICRYQGRLMLPIHDIQGRIIAFSGRLLPFFDLPHDPTREAKYVNSPETPIFIKGRELFNLFRARQAATQNNSYFYLVEGPLDVIRCWECGLKTAVAPQGTGLTEEQLKILKRYDSPIIGLFDGDKAGIKAGMRLMELGIPLELSLSYYLLEEGEDPDTSFYKTPERLQTLIQQTLLPIPFFTKVFSKFSNDEEQIRRQVIQFTFEIMTHCTSSVLRFELLKALAQELSIPPKLLEEDFRNLGKMASQDTQTTKKSIPNKSFTQSLEGQLLGFLFHAPHWTNQILKILSFDWIHNDSPEGQLLLKIINEFNENGIEPLDNRDRWQLTLQEEEIWCQLLATPLNTESEQETLTLLLQLFYRRFLKKIISDIDKEIIKSSNINAELVKNYQMERIKYKKELANVSTLICLHEQ